MITEEHLRELASFRGDPAVISLYLDVDGSRFPKLADVDPHLDDLVRRAVRLAEERGIERSRIDEDLEKVRSWIFRGFDRSRVRGLAFFVCGDLFEVVEVPRPVRNQVVLNQAPALRQLEFVLDEFQRFMVVLVDRQRARLFHFELGELVERSEVFDPVPARVDATDEGGRAASHVQRHTDELARRHLRHAAEVTFHELERSHADRVILGGPDEARSEFEDLLHSYVRERVVDRVSVSLQASESEIKQAALEVELEVERRHEAEVVEALKEAVGAEQRGVAGLHDTLRAIYERRVDLLVVSHGYEEQGWHCTRCDFLAVRGKECPMCQGEMERVDDVVGEAIDVALAGGSRVEICENADLDVLGRVGALLRF